MTFIWQRPDWPAFHWRAEEIAAPLAAARYAQGRLLGRLGALGFALRQEAFLTTLTADAVKTSEIEGEFLNPGDVRSSLARRLGMEAGALPPADRVVEGIAEITLDATRNFDRALTVDRLHGWHAALFPTGRSGMATIRVGTWRDDRDGPMQVVSGPIGREYVHFTAPPAASVGQEMQRFLDWFNAPAAEEPILKAALAHLWFVTIHPFEDGNGRIARAIADLALTRSEGNPQRFYSMSAQIRTERSAYYAILEATQKGHGDVTDWMVWFVGCLERGILGAETMLQSVLAKARFWEVHRESRLNERQIKVLNRLLDGFEGKLTSSKWAKLTKSSQDTAGRDIAKLIDFGILQRSAAGGRSVHYTLVHPSADGDCGE